MTKEELRELDKARLLDESTFAEVFAEEDEFELEGLICAARDRAAELKSKTEFEGKLKAYKKKIRRRMQDLSGSYIYRGFEYNCGAWSIGAGGVTTLTDKGVVKACAHPILPIRRTRNLQTLEEKMSVAFLRDGGWHEITVNKDVIASNTKIVQLSKNGVMVTSENARDLVRFLSDVEGLNEIPLDKSTSKFGWLDGRTVECDFIPVDQKVMFDAEDSFKTLCESLGQRGDEGTWMREVLDIRSRTHEHWETQLAMAGAFGSVLVGPLNIQPFILNTYGKTGAGKTVALMAATSVWADPEVGRYMTEALSTQNAFEARLDLLNDLPLAIDDFSKARERFEGEFTDLVYLLASGRGKDRSNVNLGLREVKTWRNIIISNMERPLWEFIRKGGGRNRVLDIPMGEGNVFPDGNRTAELLRGNYGFAGPRFVEAVRRIGTEALKDMRKRIHEEIAKEASTRGRRPQEKQMLSLSIVILADRLATDLIFKDGVQLDAGRLVGYLKDMDEVSEEQRAYETLMGLVSVNAMKFEPNLQERYSGQIWGKIDEGRGLVHVYPAVLDMLADQHGFSKEMLLRWARENGKLVSKRGFGNRAWIMGKSRVTNTFVMPDEPDAGEFVDADPEGLPFE